MGQHFRGHSALLHHRAVLAQVAKQRRQPAYGRVRRFPAADHRRVLHGHTGQVLGQCPAGHGRAIPVQQAHFVQLAHHRGDAARLV